jgi:hypothetical protein
MGAPKMTDMDMFKILYDYGSMGLFCAYLLWNKRSQDLRNRELTDRYNADLKEQREDGSKKEQEIRNRFLDVIGKYDIRIAELDNERADGRSKLSEGLSEIRTHIKENGKQIAENGISIVRLQEQIKTVFRAQHG